jgi:hypothetical protein
MGAVTVGWKRHRPFSRSHCERSGSGVKLVLRRVSAVTGASYGALGLSDSQMHACRLRSPSHAISATGREHGVLKPNAFGLPRGTSPVCYHHCRATFIRELGHQQPQEEAMPLLNRPVFRIHTTFYVFSVLAIFCANPSAAEPTTIALLRPHPISPITPLTQIRRCTSQERAACGRNRQDCNRILREAGRTRECSAAYAECIADCHRGD